VVGVAFARTAAAVIQNAAGGNRDIGRERAAVNDQRRGIARAEHAAGRVRGGVAVEIAVQESLNDRVCDGADIQHAAVIFREVIGEGAIHEFDGLHTPGLGGTHTHDTAVPSSRAVADEHAVGNIDIAGRSTAGNVPAGNTPAAGSACTEVVLEDTVVESRRTAVEDVDARAVVRVSVVLEKAVVPVGT